MFTMKRARGVTLVELMIAMVISTIVLLGVGTVYSSSKRSYKVQEEMARLQENARYAFNVMSRDIRGAGFVGCNPTINSLLNSNSPLFDFQAGIEGWEFDASGTAPGNDYTITTLTSTGSASNWSDGAGNDLADEVDGDVLVGNDVLKVMSADPSSYENPGTCPDGSVVRLQGANPANSTSLVFNCNTNVKRGELVIFGNCDRGDLFQNVSNNNASAVSRATANLTPGNLNPASVNWSQFCENCQLYNAKGIIYYIGVGSGDEPALFRYDYSNADSPVNDELVEGIENMQILYGEDFSPNDDDIQPTQYVTADNISSPDNVVAVRISLLVRTPQELNRPQAPSTHNLLGVDNNTRVAITTLSDRRIRKVFTTTIYVRNKAVTRVRN
jgi:type IV pilus assembly protein PilW